MQWAVRPGYRDNRMCIQTHGCASAPQALSWHRLRSQNATSNESRGGRLYLPYAFTEQGVAMLSGVLTSDIAIEANIHIMRAFVQVKRLGLTMIDIRRKLDGMEKNKITSSRSYLMRSDNSFSLRRHLPGKEKWGSDLVKKV